MKSVPFPAVLPALRAAGAAMLTLGILGGVQAQGGLGTCLLTGQKGAVSITPARPGRLTVETNLPSPGWWNGDTPESISDGFEYCLAANIAHRLGLGAVEVVHVAFDALVAGRTRTYDLALSQISITPERRKVVAFSTPYYVSNVGVLAKRGVKVDATNIKEMRIGVQSGTTGASFVESKVKPQHPALVFSDTSEMFTALLAGQIDVVLTDVSIILDLSLASHGRFFVAGQYRTDETYGAIFPKGSANAAVLDGVIRDLARDGTLEMLLEKYLAGARGGYSTKVPVFSQ